MTAHRHGLILGTIFFLILVHSALTVAMAADNSHAVFEGLKSVYVHVNPIDQKTAQKDISAARLRKDAEKQLKKAGIKVLSDEEYNRLKISMTYPLARLTLSVSMDEILIQDSVLDISDIAAEVQQAVFLGRKPAISMFATTWERKQINFGGSAEVQEKMMAFVAEFITAYTGANPQ